MRLLKSAPALLAGVRANAVLADKGYDSNAIREAAASKNAYATIAEIKLSDMIVRDDIGECVCEELPELHALGYCEEIEP